MWLFRMYQSYQSGIEINFKVLDNAGQHRINRTKVELKFPIEVKSSRPKKYQSYQSGIEIVDCGIILSGQESINRTKVELK